MRLDRLTTKFQQALSDAQSLAVGADNPFIEPTHTLQALLGQEDGGTAALLSSAGVNVARLKDGLKKAIERLPKVSGTGGEVQISRDLNNVLNLTDKEAQKRGDQYIASEIDAAGGAPPDLLLDRVLADAPFELELHHFEGFFADREV